MLNAEEMIKITELIKKSDIDEIYLINFLLMDVFVHKYEEILRRNEKMLK